VAHPSWALGEVQPKIRQLIDKCASLFAVCYSRAVLSAFESRLPLKLTANLRQALKKIVFGGNALPMRFFTGQQQPQQEVTVWLHGFGLPRNVTHCHGPASTIPCTFWIAFDRERTPTEKQCALMSLQFRERNERQRLLGELGLRCTHTIQAGASSILVFEASSAVNYCHPRLRLYAHTLLQRWRQRQSKSKIKLSPLEQRAMSVLFCCPRPISLVSVAEAGRASMFPLNIMSDVNDEYFAFALTASKIPAQFLESARRFALSVTPIDQAPVAFALAANHNVPSIEFCDLPFETRPSPKLRLPVPVFSPRVREMEIESVHRIGSHSLFVARAISDVRLSGGLEFSVVHGFYQAWRLRHGLDTASSIARDAQIRGGSLSGALS
jgi:flavin reductase (DIM6/NTAB) family NADH-FMN oxidoreductase RutF